MSCFSCKKEISLDTKPGFREECPHCGADLHSCVNCGFYDQSAYNECRESSADRVLEKERANFCEYFKVKSIEGKEAIDPAAEVRKKLQELFKK